MKIYCDFCGSQIETTENKTCPHCGGYYFQDKDLLDERERVKRLNELDEEKKRLENERMRLENTNIANTHDKKQTAMKAGCLGLLVALSIFGIFFILMIVCIFADEAGAQSPERHEKATTTAVTAIDPSFSVSYSFSMDPIEVPKIPEITVPKININD